MRVLTTGTTGESMPPPYGGVPKASLLYARAWKRMGHDVAVIFVYKPKNADDLGANAEYFFEYKSKPNKFKKLWFLIRYSIKNPFLYLSFLTSYINLYPRLTVETILYSAYGVFMDGVMAKFKPDVILAEAALIKTHMVLEIAQRRHIPVVIDTYAEVRDQDMGVNKHLGELEQKRYWTNFLGRAQLVLGIGNCTDGAKKYLPDNKVKEFYDTCDFTMSQTNIPESRSELRKHFGMDKDGFIIGAIGAFALRKGHDQLIRAVSKLIKRGFNMSVAICGSGDSTKWREIANAENISDRVHFFNQLSEIELIRLHRSLDLYTNISNSPRSCGLDLALLEAMASGLPIVVSDNGVLPTAVIDGVNGYVAETNDEESIAEKVHNVYIKTAEERVRMGEKSRELALKCDINLTADIKLNWFKEVITNFNNN